MMLPLRPPPTVITSDDPPRTSHVDTAPASTIDRPGLDGNAKFLLCAKANKNDGSV